MIITVPNTEGTRFWRVVEEAETRTEPYRWHSMSCVCEECLDADAFADARLDLSKIDVKGLVST